VHPTLVEIGGFTVSTFGVMMVAGFLAGWVVLVLEFRRKGFSAADAQTTVLIAALAGVGGSRLWYVLEHWGEAASDPLGALLARGGLTWYGGFLLAVACLVAFARARRIPVLAGLDAMAPALALGYAVGRVGCFLVGDDYGSPSDLPWAVAFPEGAPPTDVRVQPTQVYETVASVAILGWLWARRRGAARDGRIVGEWFVLAGLERLLVETVRTNEPVALGLTAAQIVSVGLVAAGLATLAASLRRPPSAEIPSPA
jgi:phosphatidylglycerol:prolipoprotein diacylglycerol transferase